MARISLEQETARNQALARKLADTVRASRRPDFVIVHEESKATGVPVARLLWLIRFGERPDLCM